VEGEAETEMRLALMARGNCTFKQRDLAAAIRAVRAAGCEVVRIEIDRNGKIVVITAPAAPESTGANEWDRV
jgi:hypothetical protein